MNYNTKNHAIPSLGRNTKEEPFNLGRLIYELQEWANVMGADSDFIICPDFAISPDMSNQAFYRFKMRGDKLLTMELRSES